MIEVLERDKRHCLTQKQKHFVFHLNRFETWNLVFKSDFGGGKRCFVFFFSNLHFLKLEKS